MRVVGNLCVREEELRIFRGGGFSNSRNGEIFDGKKGFREWVVGGICEEKLELGEGNLIIRWF